MRYTDVFRRAWELPPQVLEPFLLPRKSLKGLLRAGLGPEEFEGLLPAPARKWSDQILILTDGVFYYAVPESTLEPFPSIPAPELGQLEEMPAELLAELPPLEPFEDTAPPGEPEEWDCGIEPADELFDCATYYARELEHPGVRRLHEYYRKFNTYEVFFKSCNPRTNRSRSFTYGDTSIPALFRILTRAGAGPDDVFVDLGCGCGGAVLAASLLVGEARGIDLVPGVVSFCRNAARDLGIGNATFQVGDIRNADLAEASIVYCAATTFPTRLVRAINRRVREARPGTRVISITQPMGAKGLRTTGEEHMMFSWSGDRYAINHTVHYQVRV